MIALVLVAAIVTQDATPLRAAATEKAARQTLLYGGDWLELRGERQGWLQVYDHRHERPGYVRPSQVRTFPVDDKAAVELAAIIDFVRDQPGAESLGIGLVALYLRAAPPAAVGAEVFDALGGMAQRLARRGTAGPIEVAESYGIKFKSFERDGKARLCYDGEAFRRVLALPASPAAKARAALGLTEPGCVDPSLGASERETLAAWQADVLDKVDAAALPPWLGNRVRLRVASVRAAVTYAHARKGDWKAARAESQLDSLLTSMPSRSVASAKAPASRRRVPVTSSCAVRAATPACASSSAAAPASTRRCTLTTAALGTGTVQTVNPLASWFRWKSGK